MKEQSTLFSQISDMRDGRFLLDQDASLKLDMCVGVAGYPEKHFEAPSLKLDIQRLKKKVDAGAQYVVAQMFFDNKKFFDYVDACKKAGITVPIIPGLKVIRSIKTAPVYSKKHFISIFQTNSLMK